VTLDGGPRRRSESIPQRQRRRRPRMDVDEIIAKLEAGSAGEREAAYCAVEQSVRAAWAADGSSGREQAGALAVAVTRPLISSVLCAQASRVGEKEVQRAGLLLYEMARLEPVSVIGEANRKDDEGVILIHRTWVAPASVLAGILAMEPDQWTIEHAITCSTNMASQVPMWAAGCSAGIAAADMPEAEWFDESFNAPGFLAPPTPRNRHLGLALLCLDLLRGTRPSTAPPRAQRLPRRAEGHRAGGVRRWHRRGWAADRRRGDGHGDPAHLGLPDAGQLGRGERHRDRVGHAVLPGGAARVARFDQAADREAAGRGGGDVPSHAGRECCRVTACACSCDVCCVCC
jgi:hypothetical protein